jgi:hypothetical protein
MPRIASAEGRQFDEIVTRHRFERMPSFSPGVQPSGDYESLESVFLK